jgi:hypothetical protein
MATITLEVRSPSVSLGITSQSIALGVETQVIVLETGRGRSAYQSYVATTDDDPVLSETAWASGDTSFDTYVASASLNGHSAVGLNSSGQLIYASSTNQVQAIGVIRDAATAGTSVRVYYNGKVNGFSGLTVAGVYYLTNEGAISLTAPVAAGILQVVGIAVSATELLVGLSEPCYI